MAAAGVLAAAGVFAAGVLEDGVLEGALHSRSVEVLAAGGARPGCWR